MADGTKSKTVDPSKNEVKDASGLMRVEVTCVGIAPLLMNAMSTAALLAMRDKTQKRSKAAASVLTPREECVPKLYLASVKGKDVPILPAQNLFASLKEAGRQVRLDGKKQVSTAKSTVLPALMTIETVELLLVDDEEKTAQWEVDIKKGVNPNGGEAVVIIRPRFDRWRFTTTVLISTFMRSAQTVFENFSTSRARLSVSEISVQRAEALLVAFGWTDGARSE